MQVCDSAGCQAGTKTKSLNPNVYAVPCNTDPTKPLAIPSTQRFDGTQSDAVVFSSLNGFVLTVQPVPFLAYATPFLVFYNAWTPSTFNNNNNAHGLAPQFFYTYGNPSDGTARIRSYATGQCLTAPSASATGADRKISIAQCKPGAAWDQNFNFDSDVIVYTPNQSPNAQPLQCLKVDNLDNVDNLCNIPTTTGSTTYLCLPVLVACDANPSLLYSSLASDQLIPSDTSACPEVLLVLTL